MTQQQLLRTALVIPPRGRALVCLWCAVPGAIAAPFAFYRSLAAGVCFALVWGALVGLAWVRCVSFAAALTPAGLTVYAGVFWPVRRTIRREAVTSVVCLATPLARRAGVRLVSVRTPGLRLRLPALEAEGAEALARALLEVRP